MSRTATLSAFVSLCETYPTSYSLGRSWISFDPFEDIFARFIVMLSRDIFLDSFVADQQLG